MRRIIQRGHGAPPRQPGWSGTVKLLKPEGSDVPKWIVRKAGSSHGPESPCALCDSDRHLPSLAACHPVGETSFEHTVELRGITFNSSLQMVNSDYYRVLTPALERLVS